MNSRANFFAERVIAGCWRQTHSISIRMWLKDVAQNTINKKKKTACKKYLRKFILKYKIDCFPQHFMTGFRNVIDFVPEDDKYN